MHLYDISCFDINNFFHSRIDSYSYTALPVGSYFEDEINKTNKNRVYSQNGAECYFDSSSASCFEYIGKGANFIIQSVVQFILILERNVHLQILWYLRHVKIEIWLNLSSRMKMKISKKETIQVDMIHNSFYHELHHDNMKCF